MRKLIRYIVILLILCFISSKESISGNIIVNQKSYPLKAILFNNVQYAELNFIASAIFPSATIKNNIIEDKNFQIRFANSSFFVFIKKEEISNILQMNLPVISINNLLYIPIDPFLKILATNQLIKYDKVSAGYFIEHFSNVNEQILPSLDNSNQNIIPKQVPLKEKHNQDIPPFGAGTEKEVNKSPKINTPKDQIILEPVYKQKKKDGKYHIPEEIKKSIIR